MADRTTNLKVVFKTEGLENLRGLSSGLQKLNKGAKGAGISVKGLMNELKAKERTEVKSINNTRALSNGYRELARNVDMNSREFREATREANRLDKSLRKMQRTASRGMGGRLRGVAKTAGAIGAAGIFGGIEGAVGATIGGVLGGGVAGAVVGGTVGATLGGARQSLGEIGSYTAELKKQRLALKLVIGDTEQYNQAQEFLAKTSAELAIPQDVIVRQFTALTASVTGAGKSVKDAQDVFVSIASGIRGTGGSLEDMRSAMVATAQVFSKGKVSAEELRQQLGERLPGAFTLFAASMDMTPQMLDKALEQGKVTLDDFLGFSKLLFDQYGENAKILAESPAAAGDRLATEFSNFKDNFGGLFANIGALFQDATTNTLKFFNNNKDIVKKFITDIVNIFSGVSRVLGKITSDIFGIVQSGFDFFVGNIRKAFNKVAEMVNAMLDALGDTLEGFKKIPGLGNIIQNFQDFDFRIKLSEGNQEGIKKAIQPAIDYRNELKKLFEGTENMTIEEVFGTPKFDEFVENAIRAKEATSGLKKELDETFGTKVAAGMQSYIESIKDVTKQIQDTVVNAFKNMEDALVNFVMTGKLNFSDFARSLIADMTRIIIRQKIMTPLLKGISGIFNLGLSFSAMGNAFAKEGLMKYAKGGVVPQPTFFRYGGAGNLGLMGEAGAEAILPLKRGRSGNLGVESSGGGSTNIVVNVDASGSAVQGDDNQGNQLGRVLAGAIQNELIVQKRPGGLLHQGF